MKFANKFGFFTALLCVSRLPIGLVWHLIDVAE
jgi:hypothetical protein